MAEWEVKLLRDVIELRRGFDLPHRERRPGPFPVLTAGTTAGWHAEGPVKGPGFVVGRATNLGQPAWSDTDYWPLNTTLYAADFKGNLPRWAFHLFESIDLSGFDSGSVQPMLNRNYIAQIPVRVPPIREQRAIAEVLGALDDKIAANVRVAKTSDLLARAEFDLAVLEAQMGPATFADVAAVHGGGTPSSKVPEYWGGGIPWASPTDITGLQGPYLFNTARSITDAGLSKCASSLYPTGTILMTSRATIGAFALSEVPVAVNQGFIVVVPRDHASRYWLFHEMRSRVEEFLTHANGATFLELSRGNFRRLPVRIAEPAVMEQFAHRAHALHCRASAALRENARLTATRDALLPALMSGTLRVRDAIDLVEETAS